MMAAAGTGAYSSLEEGIKRAVKIKKNICRTPGCMSYYMDKFRKYKMLYEKMHDFK